MHRRLQLCAAAVAAAAPSTTDGRKRRRGRRDWCRSAAHGHYEHSSISRGRGGRKRGGITATLIVRAATTTTAAAAPTRILIDLHRQIVDESAVQLPHPLSNTSRVRVRSYRDHQRPHSHARRLRPHVLIGNAQHAVHNGRLSPRPSEALRHPRGHHLQHHEAGCPQEREREGEREPSDEEGGDRVGLLVANEYECVRARSSGRTNDL